jgi:ABC-type multidrug transport system permease subunit
VLPTIQERASSAYHLSAYFLAKTTSEAPTRLTLPLIYMTISFWLAGISNRFSVFLLSTMISLLSVLAGEAFGLLIGASIDRMDRAMTSLTVVALSMMLLGGFYVENVPVFVSWLKFLSPFKYAFDASRQIIFDRNIPCDGSGQLQDLCIDATTESVSREELLDFLGVQGSIGFNVVVLLVLGFVPRYFAFLALKLRKRGERG